MKCTLCDTVLTSKSHLDRHVKYHCSNNPNRIVDLEFTCGQCDKVFKSKEGRRVHIKKIHSKSVQQNLEINIDNSVNQNNVNNIIYLRPDNNFLEMLVKLKGSEELALKAIQRAVYGKVKAEAELFGDAYLQ